MRLAIRLGHQVALHMRWRRNDSPSDLTKSSACVVWLVILKEVMMLMMMLTNLVNLVNLIVRNDMMKFF